MFWQCSKCLRWPIIIIIIILLLLLLLLFLLSSNPFSNFLFFSNDFTTKMREKQMMILMNCDRTLRKKNEWEYQRNRNFVFGISSATILYSPLPHPFLGNCEMAVAPMQKKRRRVFLSFSIIIIIFFFF